MGDETLMVVDNSFNKTAANLQENPRASVLCYDLQTKKSFQIKGRTQIHKEGQTYDDMKTWVKGIKIRAAMTATNANQATVSAGY